MVQKNDRKKKITRNYFFLKGDHQYYICLAGGSQSSSSYNYTLILVTRFVLQVLLFLIHRNINDVNIKTLLSTGIHILARFGIHVVPVLWLLNHEPIKIYVFHKFCQMKSHFFD